MARPLRFEYPGAVYHVMARGNQGQAICADEGDRQMWVATLIEAWRRTGWRIHAWALMGNHYHLLLETPEPNLVGGMKWLQGTYTQRYNARHRKRGHLFQGRYRAVPVEVESAQYFQTLSTYIHLNPARAKLIRMGEQKLWEYPWSSYPSYVCKAAPEWLVTERVLGSAGFGPGDGRGYQTYLETRVLELGMKAGRKEMEEAWKALRRGWYVGGQGFGAGLLERVKKVLSGKRRSSTAGAAGRAHDQEQAERMIQSGMRLLGLEDDTMAAMSKGQTEKLILAWWVYGRTTVTRQWLADRLDMGYVTRVSQAVSWVEASRAAEVVAMRKKLLKCGL